MRRGLNTVVAGLGVRFAWPALPLALWPVGLVVLWSGLATSAWAMASNRHFEGTVRIQEEVGHQVVDTGPYARVRHPGYVGLILWALGSPLLLLSAVALLPAVVVTGWVVLRTALEDRFLKRELEGYADYCARVRWRLVPLVW
jgi:protein-S-isoprenylcysteine O-methyltransferase Ste14